MELLTHPSMRVIYSSHQTSLNGLPALVAAPAKALYDRAATENLIIAGPVYWIYYGMDGNPTTIFTLEIAIPITGANIEGVNASKQLVETSCFSTVHRGSWEDLGDVYGRLMEQVKSRELQISGVFREIYMNVDLVHPENNITIVQAVLQQ